MSVHVIDTIKPKNNGTFPVVEAVDVKVTNDKRLDAALNDKANQSDVTALQTAVEGKQSTLTEPQLTAVNSGITSELVTQIGTNTTAISGKASQSEVDTLTGRVTTAESDIDTVEDRVSDCETDISVQTARIDNIASLSEGSTTGDAELTDIRVKADGTTASTAGDAVREQITAINYNLGDVSEIQENLIGSRYRIQSNKNINERGWVYDDVTMDAVAGIRFQSSDNYLYLYNVNNVNYAFGNTKGGSGVSNITSTTGFIKISLNHNYTYISITTLHGNLDNAVGVFDSGFKDVTASITEINQNMEILSDIGDFDEIQYNIIGNERYSDIQTNKTINERAWLVDQSGYSAIGPIDVNDANSFTIKNVVGTLLYSFGNATGGTGIQTISLNSEEAEISVPNGYTGFSVSIANINGFDNAIIYRDTDKSDICKEIVKINDNIDHNLIPSITVDKNGNGDFTKLYDAILSAEEHYGTVVYVNSGVYDLVEELGSSYVEWASESARGIYLKNGIHLIFASNAIVKLHNTSTREESKTWLSPFNSGEGGFTLENCTIDAKDCRYCVHDERDSDIDLYKNKYINCIMKLDNTENTAVSNNQCIGGGLGRNGDIEIDGCIFESVGAESDSLLVSYHNSWSSTAKSFINVKNSYAKLGTFGISTLGQSEENTICLFSGNSVTSAIKKTADLAYKDNMTLYAWNNEIRT